MRLDSKRTREEKIKLNQHAVQEKKKKKKELLNVQVDFQTFFIDKMKEAKFRGKKTDCLPLVLRYVIFIPLII